MSKELKLEDHEEMFDIKPVGIRYICEFCNEGEMKTVPGSEAKLSFPPMFDHKCTKCGKMMLLPKIYPYIEWIPSKEEGSNNE